MAYEFMPPREKVEGYEMGSLNDVISIKLYT
jgi:hypothetical protein